MCQDLFVWRDGVQELNHFKTDLMHFAWSVFPTPPLLFGGDRGHPPKARASGRPRTATLLPIWGPPNAAVSDFYRKETQRGAATGMTGIAIQGDGMGAAELRGHRAPALHKFGVRGSEPGPSRLSLPSLIAKPVAGAIEVSAFRFSPVNVETIQSS